METKCLIYLERRAIEIGHVAIVDASCLQTPSPDLFQLCLLCFDWERFYSLKRVPLLECCLQTSIAGCLDSICRSMAVL